MKWERQDTSIGEVLSGMDLVSVTKPTPARAGPDAGTVLLYGIREITSNDPKDELGVVRRSSSDMGRSFGEAERVTINGWPRDAGEFSPASVSAVQLSDGRLRLYLSLRKRAAPPKEPDWKKPKPEVPEPKQPAPVQPVPGRPFSSNARQPIPNLVGRTQQRGDVLSAISTDGLRFSIEEGVRFRVDGLTDPEVVEISGPKSTAGEKVNGPWLMFFGREGKVRMASSADGLSWKAEESFVWSATEPTAAAVPDAGSLVRLWGQSGTGLLSATYDPATGLLKQDPAVLIRAKGTEPSVILPGDGSRLLVWNERSADNDGPDSPRPRIPGN